MASPAVLSQSEFPQSHPAITRLRDLLRRLLRVTIADGRIFLGTFAGTDQPLNLLLINTEEFRLGIDEDPNGRYVGQVVIPWRLVVKVEGEVHKENKHPDDQMYL